MIDFKTIVENIVNKRKIVKKIINVSLITFCYGCVIWQAIVCYERYASKPTGAQLILTNNKEVSLSFTFCTIIHNLAQNSNGKLFNESIKYLKEFHILTSKNVSVNLLSSYNSSLNYEFVASIPEPYLCKEFPLPRQNIYQVKVAHEAGNGGYDKNFHLFIHPTGMFLQTEMVVQYSNKIFHHAFDGKAELKMESYDLTNSQEISCGGENYHQCKLENIIKEFNNTIGCSYPIQR